MRFCGPPPPPYDWRKRPSDYPGLCNELASLRLQALSNPLRAGLRFELDLHIPAQCSLPGARAVPTISTSPSSSTVTLELDTAVQSGVDGSSYSQVWTAKVVDVPATCLVMKVIQPSLCLRPDSEDLYWFDAYYDPFDVAHNEAWIYGQLAQIQGLSIPYFFGVFDIMTPSGEAAWALVLEFISGPTVDTIAKVFPASVTHFCELGLKTVQDLALSGWSLHNMSGANFIVTNPSDNPVVVMTDLCRTAYIPPLPLERVAFIDGQRFFDAFAVCVRDSCPSFLDWAMQTLPRDVWDYDFDPEDPDVESEDDRDDGEQDNGSD
ncbi:hypothetical protein C8R45DRAFT_1219451 [Mycena sanguinolenta]|nr:hypothetical protein C8R45DRAFT_1219451 [Mycena sanguinolenta]